ncbi:type I DNA topoisomerase [Ureaplasma urealyticum]|uniref:DNA topoisomerase 1 n=1 Tax=Ureaplasma urealyticum TaxID=2130 RepID=A0ABD4SP10_UREUR|nr:type I DNA topoisomerase [Ureaplasma urealyticum]MCF1349287.1 type I DNA topoisomerase [Ureaplasma urealyticum]
MQKDLIVVESPNKIKSIQSYLGDGYNVIATGGHLRELAKKSGYDPKTYDLKWEIIKTTNKKISKKQQIKAIIDLAKKSDNIYLATDPDREGEAISWHVYDLLPKKEKERVRRITFNEITQKAILKSIDEKHDIDFNLVDSQFARRILDRVIGYKLSGLVKKNLHGLSAGRVQSIALLFVVERELERRAFVKEEWYQVEGTIEKNIFVSLRKVPYDVELYNQKENGDSDLKFLHRKDAQRVIDELGDIFKVYNVDDLKITKGDVQLPLTTDKLLQMASNNFGWSANKTTLVAQQMFEGLEINNQQLALITYPRTDSERLSDDFLLEANKFIEDNYGNDYLENFKNKKINKKEENVQDAHEAIRPVDINLKPEEIKEHVSADIYKLYNLVWNKTLAALMKVPTFNKQVIRFISNKYKFYTSYKTIRTLGYWVLDFYKKQRDELKFQPPVINVGDEFKKENIELVQKETTPPPYYTEASLIAALKNAGVGRPSTYATMATIGTTRGYINKEKGKLIPTELGIKVIQELKEAFPRVISIKFTSKMEDRLDVVANGELFWKDLVSSFIPVFEEEVKQAYTKIEKVPDEKINRLCPMCEHDLVIKRSRTNAQFIACSNFPTCRFTESLEKPEILDELCPTCSEPLIKRKNRKNKYFIGCTGYPQCNYIRNVNESNNDKNNSDQE